MEATAISLFLAAVLVGAYVQSVTGFAMGMIIIAAVSMLALASVPEITAVVSLLSLVNVLLALHGRHALVEGRLFLPLILGQLPAIFLGVALLNHLHTDAERVLRLLLAAFIVLGSLSMMLRPRPIATLSGSPGCAVAGVASGLLGGLFSASGPVMGWFIYRQPLSLDAIRATLLASFACSTTVRTLIVGAQGGLTAEVLGLSGLAVPAVVLGTWLGRSLPPPLSDAAMKRLAFVLLLLLGCGIGLRALLDAPLSSVAGPGGVWP